MTNEIWKDIEEFKGLYQVSNLGNVKGLDRWSSPTNHIYEKVLSKNWIDKDQYINLTLCKDGKRYKRHIHRLVALHFVKKPSDNPQLEVNHKDLNKQNNNADNLEWVTPLENKVHYHSSLKYQKAKIKMKQTYYEKGKVREAIYKEGIIFMYLYTDLTIHEIAKHAKTSTTYIRRMIKEVNENYAE